MRHAHIECPNRDEDEQTERHFHCFTEGGLPYICGGEIKEGACGKDEIFGCSDSCYAYIGTLDEWTYSGTMPEQRGLSGFDYSEMWGLVMAGGYPGPVSSVKTTDNGIVFGDLPDLPYANGESC